MVSRTSGHLALQVQTHSTVGADEGASLEEPQGAAAWSPSLYSPGPTPRLSPAGQEPSVKDQSGPSASAGPPHTTSLWLEKEAASKARVGKAQDRRRWEMTCDPGGGGRLGSITPVTNYK